MRRLSSLIDEFLDLYDIRTARRVQDNHNTKTWVAPGLFCRYIWCSFWNNVWRKSHFLEVILLPLDSTDVQPTDGLVKLDQSVFVPVFPALNPQERGKALYSNSHISLERSVFQQLHCICSFTVGNIIDSHRTFLQPDSIRTVQRLYPIANQAAVAKFYPSLEKDPNLSTLLQCGCSNNAAWERRMTTLFMGVDVDRSSVRSFESNTLPQISDFFLFIGVWEIDLYHIFLITRWYNDSISLESTTSLREYLSEMSCCRHRI